MFSSLPTAAWKRRLYSSCFKSLISESGLDEKVVFQKMKCQGLCKKAPIFYIESEKEYKKEVTEKKARKIFEKYIVA